MRADVSTELAVIRGWRDAQAPSETREAMVGGFLWALALVADQDVAELRARLDAPRGSALDRPAGPLPPSPVAVPPAVPSTEWMTFTDDGSVETVELPAWRGLGIERIQRTREAGDSPIGRGRAFTAGPDGRPVALYASYAEMAAETPADARGLSDDMDTPESGGAVSHDATT